MWSCHARRDTTRDEALCDGVDRVAGGEQARQSVATIRPARCADRIANVFGGQMVRGGLAAHLGRDGRAGLVAHGSVDRSARNRRRVDPPAAACIAGLDLSGRRPGPALVSSTLSSRPRDGREREKQQPSEGGDRECDPPWPRVPPPATETISSSDQERGNRSTTMRGVPFGLSCRRAAHRGVSGKQRQGRRPRHHARRSSVEGAAPRTGWLIRPSLPARPQRPPPPRDR
jgi:hypothetical protein